MNKGLTSFYQRYGWVTHTVVLVGVCFVVFSNAYDHVYNLDSTYGIEGNSYVRSLENVPLFFTDPLTLTSLRANGEYRPVLQTTFALNYAISGYQMWSWHLVQILLHAICVLGLYGLCRRILLRFHADESRFLHQHGPLLAALIFAVHPTACGVVDYLWARSSLLVAAFVLPSFLLYIRRVEHSTKHTPPWGAWVLFVLALFTKVEAVSALGVYFLIEVVFGVKQHQDGESEPEDQGCSRGLLGDLLATINLTTLRRLSPFVVITIVYAIIRITVVPDFIAEARHASDVTKLDYLTTQVTAWWHYVFNWFSPTHLVADDLTYPVFRSVFEPAVMLSITGWLFVGLMCWVTYRKHPHFTFLILAALALISPTSSFMPLAEMVNEHRPYLPLGILSLTWVIALSVWLSKLLAKVRLGRPVAVLLVGGLLVTLATMTWQRNRVFATAESYWADIQEKAPSSRSQLNYGLEMMGQGRFDEARECYEASLEDAPFWHITHINMGILLQTTGDHTNAISHFNQAVQYDRYSSAALQYRGAFFLSTGRYELALADYLESLNLTRETFPVYQALATAYAGLGLNDEALEYTLRCLELDPETTEVAVLPISTPFWESEDRYAAGIDYYRALDQHLPNRWWIYSNIGNLALRLGRQQEADTALQRASELQD